MIFTKEEADSLKKAFKKSNEKNVCPKCGSKKYGWYDIGDGTYAELCCLECGYTTHKIEQRW